MDYAKIQQKIRQYLNSKSSGLNEKYIARYRRYRTIINESAVIHNSIDDDTLEKIKEVHVMRLECISKMENTDVVSKLIDLSDKITELDYTLQHLWGFDADSTKHRWYDVPKCTCPKLDNEDVRGTPLQRTSSDCPVHMGKQIRIMCEKIENEE